VVLDSHQFDDNRISKHIRSISGSCEVFRVNYNFYRDREHQIGSPGKDVVINITPTSGPYLNGLLFTLKVIFGRKGRELEDVLLENSIDLADDVIFHVHDPYLLGLAKKMGKRFPRSRIVYDRHEYYETWKNRLGISVPGLLERMYGKEVDEIVFVSRAVSTLPKVFAGKKVTVIPNYPESKRFDRDSALRKIEVSVSGDVVAVYFGVLNLGFDRDIDLMFKIMRYVMQARQDVRFEVAGRVYDTGVKDIIGSMTKEFGERMKYLGEIPFSDVVTRTTRAHLGFFLLRPESPMWSEERPTSPNKVYEFLLSGTVPVVRANLDDKETIEGCALSFGKDAGSEEISGAILELIEDRQNLRTLMERCLDVSTDFSWENVSGRYLECYERLFYITQGE